MSKELAPKAHVQVKFCSDPVRSEDYFPEWKTDFTEDVAEIEFLFSFNVESWAIVYEVYRLHYRVNLDKPKLIF